MILQAALFSCILYTCNSVAVKLLSAMNRTFPAIASPTFRDSAPVPRSHRDTLEAAYMNRRHDLLRFLRHFGVNPADAEEITQDVFARAIEPSREIPANLFAWLVTCAKNLAIKRHLRDQRESTISDVRWRIWEAKTADGRLDAHRELERRERVKAFKGILATMDPMEARCLILRSQGLTFREIGERLDIPLRRASYLATAALEKVEQAIH